MLNRLRQRWASSHAKLEQAQHEILRYINKVKRHPNPWIRRGLGLGLILGGVFAFLPILGIWMLPLGLLVLSNESDTLRRTRRRLRVRLLRRWRACQKQES